MSKTYKLETYGDLVRLMFRVKDEEEAKEIYEFYIGNLIERGVDNPQYLADQNIGFALGEGLPQEKIAIWRKAVNAVHPIFGTCIPTPEEAFNAGKRSGEALRKKAGDDS